MLPCICIHPNSESRAKAVRTSTDRTRSKEKILALKDRVFGFDTLQLDRPLRLVRLILRIYVGESLLQDCKDYFKQFSRIPSCFVDLRRSVEKMSDEERTDFLSFIEEDMKATRSGADDAETKLEEWARAELCVLKFTYLIAVSLPTSSPSTETLQSLIERASNISQMLPKDQDATMLIAYCLTKLQHLNVESDDASGRNSKLLLQAAMIARTAVERDMEKHNRPLALLTTRLHLNLGLGTAAFQVWKTVKPSIKEMLVDTLSPYLLSRIALTQPFDVKHHKGYSANTELKHAVDTVDRMSKVQEGLIFRDIKRFHWDSAMDLISMNEKLTTSLTRHTSILERRRIARLKSEPAGDLPDVTYRSKICKHCTSTPLTHRTATQTISDNIDRSVFPAYEHSGVHRPYSFLMPADISSTEDVLTQYHNRESVSKILYHDGTPVNWTPPSLEALTARTTPAERLIAENFWHPISSLLYAAINSSKADATYFSALLANLKTLRQDQEKLVVSTPTGSDPVDEPTMITESMLITSYSALEILRLLPRLASEINTLVIQPKTPHPMKASVPKEWAKQIDAEVKGAYEAIGKVANSYINLLQKRGVVAIKAQVRWGKTGSALEGLVSESDVDHYAREYVDAAVEAWKGVLSVKLK
jgi:N-terminal acetyltransferase B complex non-catalytic subunit